MSRRGQGPPTGGLSNSPAASGLGLQRVSEWRRATWCSLPRRRKSATRKGTATVSRPETLLRIMSGCASIQPRICGAGWRRTGKRSDGLADKSTPQQEGGQPMFTPQSRTRLWQNPTGYAASHCSNCEAGWTRTGKDGGKLTICLLDREPVLTDMTDCDRFEPKETRPV